MCYIALVEKLIFKIVYGAMPTNCTSSSKKKSIACAGVLLTLTVKQLILVFVVMWAKTVFFLTAPKVMF